MKPTIDYKALYTQVKDYINLNPMPWAQAVKIVEPKANLMTFYSARKSAEAKAAAEVRTKYIGTPKKKSFTKFVAAESAVIKITLPQGAVIELPSTDTETLTRILNALK